MTEGGFIEYANFCGRALARAHSRYGNPFVRSDSLGRRDVSDRAMATLAWLYADQAERDQAALVAHLQPTQRSTLG